MGPGTRLPLVSSTCEVSSWLFGSNMEVVRLSAWAGTRP
jgi:hypothetical protein